MSKLNPQTPKLQAEIKGLTEYRARLWEDYNVEYSACHVEESEALYAILRNNHDQLMALQSELEASQVISDNR